MDRKDAFNKFSQSVYRRIATSKVQQNPRPVQGPELSSGNFYSKPEGRVEKTIRSTDSLVGKNWSVEAWQQRTQTNYQQMLSIYKNIDDSTVYMYKGQLIYGRRLKGELGPQVDLAKQQFHQALEMEKGYTVIKKTDEGFTIETDYKRLLQDDPGRAAALGWSWGGLGNIDIAFYKLTGQEDKATAKQVEQIKNVMYAKQKLAEGDIKEFSIQYWSGYLSMPSTQIGFAYGAGLGVGAISKVATPVIAAKGVGTQLAIRGGTLAAGASLGGFLAYHVAEPGVARGDWGESLGRGWVTGTGVIAGAAGYQAAFKTGAEYKSFMMARSERPTFIKEFVKAAPNTYDKLVHKIPGIGPMGYLKGPGVQPKPFGFGRTGGFIYKGVQTIGKTKFWQNIHGWAAKGYAPSQTYYLFQEGVYDDSGYRIQPTRWQRKSWLEKSWIPKEKVKSFQEFIKGSGDIDIHFPTSRDLSEGTIRISGFAEGKVVKFGRGWFRHTYISSEVEKNINVFTKSGKIAPRMGGYGSYKRGGIVDIVPDYSPPPQRPESFFGKLIKGGYWGKSKPHYIDVKKSIEGGPEWISGFGATRPKTSYHLLKNIDQWKRIPAGIIRDIRANASLKMRTDQLMISPAKDFSSFGRSFVNVPISGKIPRTPFIGFPFKMDVKPIQEFKTPSVVSVVPIQQQIKIPSQIQFKIPIQDQIRIPIQMQSKIPIQDQIRIPMQVQIQTPIQTQTNIQKLIETPIETITTTIKTPTIKTPNINIVVPPPPIPEFDEWDKRKPKFDASMFDLSPGYRWREWKTPKLQDVLKI